MRKSWRDLLYFDHFLHNAPDYKCESHHPGDHGRWDNRQDQYALLLLMEFRLIPHRAFNTTALAFSGNQFSTCRANVSFKPAGWDYQKGQLLYYAKFQRSLINFTGWLPMASTIRAR